MSEHVGQRIGHYQLVQLLGRGGFASVYLGQHVQLGTQAAVKVFFSPSDADQQAAILAEARTYARLDHPHVLRMFEYGLAEQTPYLVMQYAPGGTLRSLHPPGGALIPLERILLYTRQVASALQYAHDQQVVHRDVKPANMLVGTRNEVLLGDFGIAIAAHTTSSHTTQDSAGTVRYMAPEHAHGHARAASDQYSLAICVYEWITGEPPFQGKSFIEIALQHREAAPLSLVGRRTMLAIDEQRILTRIDAVLMKALAKDPKERFSCVLDFAQALEHCLADSTPPPRGTTAVLLHPHVGCVYTLAWSPDGHILATGGEDATVQLTQRTTGQHLRSSLSHHRWVSGLAWSPDGRSIASASADATVQVWRPSTGAHLRTYRGHTDGVDTVVWSPDGRTIASSSMDATVQLWDPQTGVVRRVYREHSDGTPHRLGLPGLAWSSDGRMIASGGEDKQVHIWEAQTGARLVTLRCPELVEALAFSPDGTSLACALFGLHVQVWDVQTGHVRLTYRDHPFGVHCLAWSPDGHFIASGGEQVHVWNARTGARLVRYSVHPGLLQALAWSPDGTCIASASGDGMLCIWHV